VGVVLLAGVFFAAWLVERAKTGSEKGEPVADATRVSAGQDLAPASGAKQEQAASASDEVETKADSESAGEAQATSASGKGEARAAMIAEEADPDVSLATCPSDGDDTSIRMQPQADVATSEEDERDEPESHGSKPGLYTLRTRPRRETWLRTRGATSESEMAVAAGLAWLARHQSAQGVWCNQCLAENGSNRHARCQRNGACSGPGVSVDMAHTGLALLAFQAGGHYHFNNRMYSENVERGLT
jgi:hypothetical protein